MTRDVGAPRVVVGVGGGIAAYKAAELIRRLRSGGAEVTVVPTPAALEFVGAATFEALSGRPVATDVWTEIPAVQHVHTGQHTDLVVIAPATADLMARAATGRADDLLTATLLVTRAPVLMAPAMHTEMWTHPATVDNVATLRRRGTVVLDPAVGRLTGADSGPGRLPDPEHIAALAELLLQRPDALPQDLAGRRVLITAGGTREPLDPVRYLGNRSSGKQGFALALVAAARGAAVTLVAANTSLPTPPAVDVVPVGDARELQAAVQFHLPGSDVVVMAAAVADFRPVDVRGDKIKKTPGTTPDPIALTTNPDILAGLVRDRAGARNPVIVGFAAETGDADGTVLEHGRAKLARKGCDLLVVNPVDAGRAFGTEDNEAVLLGADGSAVEVALTGKHALAARIWDAVTPLLP
ncbi:bifunctional phosphopantothenoylcysteine decarboxylase/phosphopantothenate--cysteine ligase CoaBC [Nakamurella sp. YIM 132087]|uniref:Coenzyme A biosynthesis bifunctional protein CoaBC n=1 Tax=Nakamurella alba TaxID=2665158 RepID=A0A7K1FIZ2_9ACTN|nr:bifunctional phosphopantothenoylcysteine decarboxylase/phosphopantothenate--cysteine ligase CoaBC [Nakamurella alba]